jgi:outer membrane protein
MEEENLAMKLKTPRRLLGATVLCLILGGSAARAQQNQPLFNPATSTDFTHSEWFPRIFNPYTPRLIPEPKMTNSELLHSLIVNGQLQLSLSNAIALALQNNLQIDVARYSLAYAQTDILRTKAGGTTRGINPALFGSVTAFGASGAGTNSGGTGSAGGVTGGGGARNVGSVGCCDPFAGVSFGWDHNTSPLNFVVVSGVPVVTTQTTNVTTFFGKGFLTGTSFVAAVSGFRQSTTSLNTLFNPEVPSGLTLGFNQHLLNGFGYRANAKFIRIAENNVHQADSTFRQTVMTVVAQVADDYYQLLYYRQNVQVAQQALAYDKNLLADDQKQVQIGTLAPLEVIRAESQVATDQQNLIVAQTNYLEQQEVLKTELSKHVDPDLAAAHVDATSTFPAPSSSDIPSLQVGLQEAEKYRPEIEQARINIRNQDVTIQQSRNALLPSFDVFGTYSPTGLSGMRLLRGSSGGVIGVVPGGIGQSLTQLLHGNYPDYSFGVTLSIPIRNRSAQADMATAMLQQRQLQEQLQQTRNQVAQDVRNAEIAVTQARAQIAAAKKAVRLALVTLQDERKKLELGESTTLNVILTEEQYDTALGNEAQAFDNYAKSVVQFGQATGTTLQKYNIQLSEAKAGEITRVPNIPGAPSHP